MDIQFILCLCLIQRRHDQTQREYYSNHVTHLSEQLPCTVNYLQKFIRELISMLINRKINFNWQADLILLGFTSTFGSMCFQQTYHLLSPYQITNE